MRVTGKKENAMKRKTLLFTLVCLLGLALFFVWKNLSRDRMDHPSEVSIDGIQVISLSVYEYRPIFISSLGEKLQSIEEIGVIRDLVDIMERAQMTDLQFKEDFEKYDYQVSMNDDSGEILLCFKGGEEEDAIYLEKRFDGGKVYRVKRQDMARFKEIFEKLQG